jgi:hypothetical protein
MIGLGVFSVVERSKRQALEVALAGLEQRREPAPPDVVPPVLIASNEISPYSYRVLSLRENPDRVHEWDAKASVQQSARARTGAEIEQAPLRVRDTGKLLEF